MLIQLYGMHVHAIEPPDQALAVAAHKDALQTRSVWSCGLRDGAGMQVNPRSGSSAGCAPSAPSASPQTRRLPAEHRCVQKNKAGTSALGHISLIARLRTGRLEGLDAQTHLRTPSCPDSKERFALIQAHDAADHFVCYFT